MVRSPVLAAVMAGTLLLGLSAARADSSDDYGARQLFTADAPGTPEGRPLSSNAPDRAPDGRLVKKNHLSDEAVEIAVNPDIRIGLNPYRRLLDR